MDGDLGSAFDERAGGQHASEALRLDGNAAAGILSEVFVPDVTTALATCANCGTIRALGALLAYTNGMGTVLRCASCDAVVLRAAHLRMRLWLDLTGARLIVMAAAAPSVA